ncbi:MAG: PKD domain-containing protein [Planctomycetes bacterium]|nr:PKD domain-containing protein [Planctomycetota bacterium]
MARRVGFMALSLVLAVCAGTAAVAQSVPLDISDGFNMDIWCGPLEMQDAYTNATQTLKQLQGDLADGMGWYAVSQYGLLVCDSTSGGFGEPYSISGQWFHPLYLDGLGTPEDGVLTGGDRDYHIASVAGNDTLEGDWTEVADPSSGWDTKSNAVLVGSLNSTASWQVSEVEIELPSGQKDRYSDVNFVLAAANLGDRARNMRIVALYGAGGTDEEVLYGFATADGGSGPRMVDQSGGTDFQIVNNFSKCYDNTTWATGTVLSVSGSLYEFDAALELDDTKTLWGFRVEDVNPSLNWNARGVVVLAASATPAEKVLEFQVGASVDDAAAQSAYIGTTESTLYWPYSDDTRRTFLRFRTFIPDGATITEAYVKIKSDGAKGNSNTSTVRVQLLDYDNCPPILEIPYAWDVTETYVDSVTPGEWTAGTWYSSDDLSDLVQEFIDRPGYTFGSFIGLRGQGGIDGSYKRGYSWNYGDHTSAPKLEIHYVGGATHLELWMADPETRLGQKVYCQLWNAPGGAWLRAKLDGDVVHTSSAALGDEEVFTVDYRSLSSGQHTLLVEVFDSGDSLLVSESRTWTKLHDGIAKVAINEHNAICLDGEPFFPITPWGIGTSQFSTFEGQINTLCGQSFGISRNPTAWEGYLDAGYGANLPAIGPAMGDYFPDGNTERVAYIGGQWVHFTELDPDRMEDYIEVSRYHPGMFMYCWQDEPDLGGTTEYMPATEVRAWTELCHSMDTEHPHFCTIVGYSFSEHGTEPSYNNHRAQSYCFLYNDLKTGAMGDNEPFDEKTVVVDVWTFDYYPYERALMSGYSTWIGLEDLTECLDNMRQWNYNLIPTMTWIETCDIEECTGEEATPCITPTELWNLVWLSIVHEVKGINWFHYFGETPSENRVIMAKTLQWTTVLAEPILSPPEDVTWTVTHEESNNEPVHFLTRECDDRLYIFAAHISGAGAGETVRFNVDGLPSGQAIGVVGEGRTVTSAAGYFEDSFSPLAVHIYTYPALVNMPPVANAGNDGYASDNDNDGYELVTLDGTDSFDADGSLVSYVWKEGVSTIATGATAQVSLTTGTHEITLLVTDDDSDTDGDVMLVLVNPAPVADAGEDQEEEDTDENGSELITLDGSGSYDSLGEIVSYVWTEGGNEIATGETAQVTMIAGTHTVTLTVTDDDGATDSDGVVIEVINEDVVVVQYQIAASTEDTYCVSSESVYLSTVLYIPYTSTTRRTFFRWPITVPDGVTILAAELRVKATGNAGDSNTSTARLQLVDTDSCVSFYTNPYSYSVTAGYVDWVVPGAWAASTWYTSSDIKTIVQEFIDRAGYSSGNYLGLRLENVSGLWKTAYQWDYGDHTHGAILQVTYLP